MKIQVQVKANIKTQAYGGKNPEKLSKNVNQYLRFLYFFMGIFLFILGIFCLKIFAFFGVILLILGILLFIGGIYYKPLIAWIQKKANGSSINRSIDQYDFLFVFDDSSVTVTAILDENPVRNLSFLYEKLSHIEIYEDSIKVFPFKKTYYYFNFSDFKDDESKDLINHFKKVIPEKVNYK
jgi:hypothetical protein